MVGYVLAWKGWFSTESQMLLPKLVTYVARRRISCQPFLTPLIVTTFCI